MFNRRMFLAGVASLLAAAAASASVTGCTTGIPVEPRPVLDPPTPIEAKAFAKGSNAFGVDLYKAIADQKGNIAISPASISMALAMTWAGAKGETADEMKKVLHFEGSPADVAAAAGKLSSQLTDPERPVKFQIANQLFGEASIQLEQPFLDQTKSAFGAPLAQLDFKKDAGAARVKINDWVSAKTEKRIQDLIPDGGVTGDTRLVLVNALYFLGDWEQTFEKEATYDGAFITGAGAPKTVPMMHSSDHASYKFVAKDGVKALSIPYKGGSMSMLFVLPDEKDGLPALEKTLSAEKIDELVLALEADKRVAVTLPKFEIDPASSLSLGDTLVKLGMPTAFDETKADFTSIFNPPSVEDRLHIEKVFHKAFLKLDEKGTEAAAATAVVMNKATAAMPSNDGEFIADHPFLFILRDESSGLAIFMGRVDDPSQK